MSKFRHLIDALELNRNSDKGITFIQGEAKETFLSYKDLYDEALRTLYILQNRGVSKGQHVLFQIDDNRTFVKLFWGCLLGGMIPVPVTVGENREYKLKVWSIWALLEDAYLCVDSDNLSGLQKTALEFQPSVYNWKERIIDIEELHTVADGQLGNPEHIYENDVAFIQFSSGSTGSPKGVTLTHRNLVANCEDLIESWNTQCCDISMSWMPLTHDMGLIAVHLASMIAGIHQIIMPASYFIRNPMGYLRKVSEHRATMLYSPNFGIRHMLDHYRKEQLNAIDLSRVRSILNGAEPISVPLCHQFEQVFSSHGLPSHVITPGYGLAEASVGVTCSPVGEPIRYIRLNRNHLLIGEPVQEVADRLHPDAFDVVDVGISIARCQLRVCDNEDHVLEENRVGHIQIRGDNVTGGYYRNADATSQLFTHDGWLRTGDLGLLRNGRLYMTGRAKDMICVNGQNIYPHDVERAVESGTEAGIGKTAACGVYDAGTEQVVIFVVHRQSIAAFHPISLAIKACILKGFGLQVRDVVPVKRLPKTTSGKVQRYLLKEAYERGQYDQELVQLKHLSEVNSTIEKMPLSRLEQELLDIWQATLGKQPISVDDRLFEIGAHSLSLVKLAAKIDEQLNIQLPLSVLYEHSNIRSLAAYIESQHMENIPQLQPLLHEANDEDVTQPFPLTDIQMAYFIGRNEEFEYGGVSTHYYMEMETPIADVDRLNRSFQRVIERHPMLRTIMLPNGTQQVLAQVPPYAIHTLDYSRLDDAQREQSLLRLREQMSHRIFETGQWPLFECKAVKLDRNDTYRIIFSIDLLLADGSSIQLIGKEWMNYYRNPSFIDEPLTFTFRDYVLAYKRLRETDLYSSHRAYWLNRLDTIANAPELPVARISEQSGQRRFDRVAHTLQAESWNRLKQTARQRNLTPSALLCALYAETLSRWSNQAEFVLNLTTFNRVPFHQQVEQIVGDFTSLLLLHVRWRSDQTLWQQAQNIQKQMIADFDHRLYDGVEFIREIAKHRAFPYHRALYPVVFTSMLFEAGEDTWSAWGEMKYAISQTSQVILDHQVMEKDGNLQISWDYAEDAIEEQVIASMFHYFVARLERLAMSPDDACIYSLPPADQALLDCFNATEESIEPNTLHGLFARQAVLTPEHTAVVDRYGSITYRELHERSDRLAAALRTSGVGCGDLVALVAHRTVKSIIQVIGILKAGAAYVPVDPDYPMERKRYIAQHSQYKLILDENSEEQWDDGESPSLEAAGARPDHMAYVLYTSGSTGTPKGVAMSHGAVVNTIVDMNRKLHVNHADRILGVSSLCFDLSVYDVFGALSAGAALVLAEDQRDSKQLLSLMKEHGVTIWNSVPALMEMVMHEASRTSENLPLRAVLLSGDWIPISLPAQIKRCCPKSQIVSLGGATEAAIWSIYYPIEETKQGWTSIPYGKPLANQQFYVLNEQSTLCPVGVEGELHIGGTGLAIGYYRDPDKTNKAFIEHPDLGRLYRTGDYGVLHADGYIEFRGRRDFQVKIRGYRVEIGEIESVLAEHPHLNKVMVDYRALHNGVKALCAYYTSTQQVEGQAIREYAANRLPKYMIPAHYMRVDAFPLNVNGKVDRRQLPEPAEAAAAAAVAVDPASIARNELDKQIHALWSDLLHVESILLDDDFFEIGGNSLQAQMLQNKVQDYFGAKMPMRDFFAEPTIRRMSDWVCEYRSTERLAVMDEAAVSRDAEQTADSWMCTYEGEAFYSLLPSQKRLYFLQQLHANSVSYHFPVVIRIKGRLQIEKLAGCFAQVMSRHEALRASFRMVNDEPMQCFHEAMECDWEAAACEEEELDSKLRLFIRPFDLNRGPLLRAGVFRLDVHDHVLILDGHHLIADGTSLQIILKELSILYRGDELPEQERTFRHCVGLQQRLAQSVDYDKARTYWLEQMAGELPVLQLPADRARTFEMQNLGTTYSLTLNADITQALKEIGLEQGASLYMTILTTLYTWLHRFSGQEDIIIGTTTSGRLHSGTEHVVGMLAHTLAIRQYPASTRTFADFLQEVKRSVAHSLDCQTFPLDELVEALSIQRDINRNPLFDVMFAYQNMELSMLELGDGVHCEQLPYHHGEAKLDLSFEAKEANGEIHFLVEYNAYLFNPDTIERMMDAYKLLVNGIAHDPTKALGEYALLHQPNSNEAAPLNGHGVNDAVLNKTIVNMFEGQAQRTPDRIALQFGSRTMTYQELNRRASAAARRLIQMGASRSEIVAIQMERAIEPVVAMLAVLKAGAAFLPLDPDVPIDRTRYILEDCSVRIVMTRVDDIEQEQFEQEQPLELELEHPSRMDDLAYVIYTSGSTGMPKGVMIPHRGIANTVQWRRHAYAFTPEDRVLHLTSFSFDASISVLFSAFAAGASVILQEQEQLMDAQAAAQAIKNERITHFACTPSLFAVLTELMDQDGLSSVRAVTLGGEPVSPQLVATGNKLNAKMEIINEYGPSENSVVTTWCRLEPGKPVTIGQPIPQVQVYIVNSHQQLQPIGVAGELCIAGEGLASGYVRSEALTDRRFVQNPFGTGKMYKSGDMARLLPNGQIEYIGRMDDQVKIRGYRIECQEITQRVLEHPDVREAVVAPVEDRDGRSALCAYYVPHQSATVKGSSLSAYLERTLPSYMIPSYWVSVQELPLNANGKLDKTRLPDPIGSMNEEEFLPMEPGNEDEERLAEVWKEVLDVASIGVEDNFFQIGGHSLKAAVLASRMTDRLQLAVSIKDIYQAPTIRALSRRLHTQHSSGARTIPPASIQPDYPVSIAQRGMLYSLQKAKSDTSYNMPSAIRIEGQLDVDRLTEGFVQLIERHEQLRTRFWIKNGQFRQAVVDDVTFSVLKISLAEQTLEEACTQFVQPFDWEREPLIRAGVIQLDEAAHLLLLDMHHLVSDGVSVSVFIQELESLYHGETLPDGSITYKDFAQWQEEQQHGDGNNELLYWHDKLRGLQYTQLPVKTSAPLSQATSAALDFELDEDTVVRLERFCTEHGITKFAFVLAVFKAVLHLKLHQHDLSIGVALAGRLYREVEQVVGNFVQTVVIRTQVNEQDALLHVIKDVQRTVAESQQHQEYAFDQLYFSFKEKNEWNFPSLYSILFNYFAHQESGLRADRQIKMTPYWEKAIKQQPKHDTALYVHEIGRKLSLHLVYKSELFEHWYMEQLMAAIHSALLKVLVHNDITIEALQAANVNPLAEPSFAELYDNDDLVFDEE